MSLSNEPVPLKPAQPVPAPRPMSTFIKGLGLGLLVAIVCTLLTGPRKGIPGLMIPAVAFLGTVVVWTIINAYRNRRTTAELDLTSQCPGRVRNRILLAIAALLIGPFGGAWLGYMAVLLAYVNPLDRAYTIAVPAFLGLVASGIVATAIIVSLLSE